MKEQTYSNDEKLGFLGIYDGVGGNLKEAAKRAGLSMEALADMVEERSRALVITPKLPNADKSLGTAYKKTPERLKAILDSLREGNTRRSSSAVARVAHTTLANWISEDEDFRELVEAAEAEAEQMYTKFIRRAAPESWQAGAWWLERRKTKDWRAPVNPQVADLQNTLDTVLKAFETLDPDTKSKLSIEFAKLQAGAVNQDD